MRHDKETVNRINAWLGTGSINIFGMPFAGKDTLAHNLSKHLEAPVISGGDILRSHHDQETIKRLMTTGELFPTDYYLGIIIPFISKDEFKKQPLLLSSVGRWSGEEPTIVKACEEAGHPIKAAIYLHVPTEVVWQRFEASQKLQDRSHRHDDAAHVLEVRLEEFNKKTLPVIEFYRQQQLLVEVDGKQEITDTTAAALAALTEYAKSKGNI